MLSGSCGTRDEPYIPRRRADASVLKRALSWGHLLNIYKLKATSCGLFLHPESLSQNSRPEWDAVSPCCPVGKARPTPITNSGSHFPPSPSTGNRIPFQRQIPGHSFRNPVHPESPSHSEYVGAWDYQPLLPGLGSATWRRPAAEYKVSCSTVLLARRAH